jgi:hypothetical protein
VLLSQPLADGVYHWRVTARDLAGNTADSQARRFRVDTRVQPAVLIRPVGGIAVGELRPTFVWSHTGDVSPPVDFTLRITGDAQSGSFRLAITTGNFNTAGQIEFRLTQDLLHGPGGTGDYTWSVRARDSAGTRNRSELAVGTFRANRNRPAAPLLVSPINSDTAALDPTFVWQPDGLASFYTLLITADSDTRLYTIDDIPHVPPSGTQQTRRLSDLAQLFPELALHNLAPGALYHWTVRGKTTGDLDPLSGPYAPAAAFVTTGATADLVIDVSLQGTGDGAADFEVKLYESRAYRGIDQEPWLLFIGARAAQVRRQVQFTHLVGTADGASNTTGFSMRIPGVATGFFDITVEANSTLINLRDDVAIEAGMASVNMGTAEKALRAGNAANDPRPGVELASIINALDASVLVAAFDTSEDNPIRGNKRFDPRADFDRDGDVDRADLALLEQNYLRFSPITVIS